MSLDENMTRWIWASVTKHFDAYRQGLAIRFEGYERLEQAKDSLQIRMDGPNYERITVNESELTISLNILITSIKDDSDAHKIYKMVGIVAAAFIPSINIYKFGTPGDNSLIGCMLLDGPIIVTHFGAVEATSKVLQSTVEGQYRRRA